MKKDVIAKKVNARKIIVSVIRQEKIVNKTANVLDAKTNRVKNKISSL
jgi:hypothetical protein